MTRKCPARFGVGGASNRCNEDTYLYHHKGTIWYYRNSEHKVTVLTVTELFDIVINFNGYENLGMEEVAVADLEELEGLQGLANYTASFEDA